MSHSPGPWEWRRLPGGSLVVGCDALFDASGKQMPFYGGTGRENPIDARLIAAAPEMREELRDICEAMELETSPDNPRCLRIRALIARIEGNP